MRLTLDSSSQALTFSSNLLTGFDQTLYPRQGYNYPPVGDRELRVFDWVQGAYLNTGLCDGLRSRAVW